MTRFQQSAAWAAGIIIAAAVAITILTAVAPAAGHPCDTAPNDPRCGGTTTTTTTSIPSDAIPIGIVSGSNGDRYWNEAVQKHGLPAAPVGLGGGDTHRWGTPGARAHDLYWSIFDGHAGTGPVHVWWYALSRGSTTSDTDGEAEADVIVAKILELRPDAIIHATPMAGYDPDGCTRDNVPASEHLVAYAIDTYDEVIAGPVIDTVRHTNDGCHPSGESLADGAAALAGWYASVADDGG